MGLIANTVITHPSYREVLAIKPFRHLWFGQIGSQLAINTLLFVLAIRIYETTQTNTAVSGLFLAYGLPAVLFGMVAGTAVDHLDRRRVLIICDIVRAVVTLSFLLITPYTLLVYIAMLINAVVTQFYIPSEAPTIPRLVPERLIIAANSMFSFTFYSTLAIGSVLAGPLLRLFGSYGIFLFIGSLFLFASWQESKLPPQGVGSWGLKKIISYSIFDIIARTMRSLVEGVRYVKKSRKLSDSILLLTGTQIILALLATLGPGFADRVVEIDVRDASVFIVGPAVLGIILGAVWVGLFGYNISRKRLMNTGIFWAGGMLIAISVIVRLHRVPQASWLFTDGVRLPVIFLLFFLLGVANSLLDVPANTTLQDEARGSMRGRVYGILTASVGGVGLLPVVVGGILADVVGVGKVVFSLGIGIFLYGILRMKYNKI